jgi:hypothetical protein
LNRFKTAAVASIAALSVSAVAVAQSTEQHTMTASSNITKPGTKKKPKPAVLKVGLVTPQSIDPTVETFTYQVPKQLKVSTKGFKYCTLQKMAAADSDEVCPKGSQIGKGLASARVNSRTGAPISLVVTIYANRTGMTMWLEESTGALQIRRAIPVAIVNVSGGQNLVATIPDDVKYAAGAKIVLEQVQVQLGATRRAGGKRHYAVGSVGCARSGKMTIGTQLKYAEPKGYPITNAKTKVACRR